MISELTQRLQSAAKGKAPIVAIPIEGHAPVCLNRKRLATWSKGVEITKVEVRTSENNHRWLEIRGRVPGTSVTTTCKMVVVTRQAAALELWNWAEKERAKNLKLIGQGAISTAALKVAKKEAKAKEKAAKLVSIEKGDSTELDRAKREEMTILAAARNQGSGARTVSPWEAKEADDKKAEQTVRHVSHHNVSPRVRKTASVIQWRLRALSKEWYDVTKYNPHRRKTTANKFLKVKKAIRIIQIVKDWNVLVAKLQSIRPERVPHPRWPGEEYAVFAIDPLSRPDRKPKTDYWHSYSREGMAIRLRAARETIRLLTPPVDELEIAA